MASVSVPEAAKPITILAVSYPPIERVALLRGFHDGPSVHAHHKAEYTTATARFAGQRNLSLTGESIHELLAAMPVHHGRSALHSLSLSVEL